MADQNPSVYDAAVRAQTAGLVLAGGRGARMHAVDKGLQSLQGEPLVAHVVRRLSPYVAKVFVSANRNQEVYAAYGAVVSDDAGLGAFQGPLAGLASGLAAWSGQWLVTAPCDSPFLPEHLAGRLVSAAQAAQAPLAVATCGGRRQAVCMAVHTALLPDLMDYLRGADRKVALLQDRVGGIEVDFSDTPQAFININTLDELAQAATRYDNQ